MTDCPYLDKGEYQYYCQCTTMLCMDNDKFKECSVFKDFEAAHMKDDLTITKEMRNMPIKCLKCKTIIDGNALFGECPNCDNQDLSQFFRVDDDHLDPVLHERDKEWLESRKI